MDHMNHFREANSTNLHIHGIYDSPEHDDTFACIPGGQSKLYNYVIDDRTGTSTLWYHPHWHGSSSMQLYGGMAGAFEIVDEKQESALGFNMLETETLVLQYLNLDPNHTDWLEKNMVNNGSSMLPVDLDNPEDYQGPLLLSNGRYQPQLKHPIDHWMRLKLINAASGANNMMNFGFDSPRLCELRVLAYDGVYLQSPRPQPSVVIPPGGRADIAVKCSQIGLHKLRSVDPNFPQLGQFVPVGAFEHACVVLDVIPVPAGRNAVSLPKVLPGPPSFYPNLLQARPDGYHTILMSNSAGDNIVSGWPYNGSVSHQSPQWSLEEWSIFGSEGTSHQHPYHQHTTHFQIIASSFDTNGLFGEVGDYRDTVPLYTHLNFTIRFTFPFCGRMMVHCHILTHEDRGMMTLINVTNATSTASPWKYLTQHGERGFLV
jgi:FtsP/CotA-like multicopper oxidase with cupredoxin domain